METQFKDCYFRREGDEVVLGNSRIDCGGADDPKGMYYTKEKPLEAATLGI